MVKRREYQRNYGLDRRRRDPEEMRARGRQNYANNREARLKYAANRRADHGDYLTLTRSLSRYGLTLDQYHSMQESQDFCCAICGEDLETPHIDHCHATQRVRGLLCMVCNLGLGLFRDHPERLAAAIAYLA